MIWEYIDMQNENALIALSYIGETENPLQVFCNYVIICLIKSTNKSLRYDELAIEIEKISGLKMSPYMLKMCCNILKKEGKILKLQNGAGYKLLDKSFNIVDFELKAALFQEKEKAVINDIISYVKEYNVNWEYENARSYLTDFLLYQGNAIKIFANNSVKDIKAEKNIPTNWYIGKYITNLMNNPNDLTSYLIDIINGLMIYIGVYEAQDYQQNYAQKFNGTKFFFDTKLMLRLMGYSWKLETASVKELYELIKLYNGSVYVFEHTIGEIEYALGNAVDCIKNKNIILDFELRTGVELKNFNEFDLDIDRKSVRRIIEEELKIKVHPDIDWGETKNQIYNLDREYIINYISQRHPHWKHRAIDNDVDIINYINILRKGNYTCKYGGTKRLPVFITSNTLLVYDIKSYIEDNGENDKKIADWNSHALPVITDSMLMCRLWVPKSNLLSSLPTLTLARNAYAAQQTDTYFFEKLRETAIQLKNKHKVDLINVSTIMKDKLEEIVIRNISGNIDELTEDILASSADELIKLETMNLKSDNQRLKKENLNQLSIIEKNNKILVESVAQRYKNKLGMGKILIYIAKYYWIIATIVFGILSLLLSFFKGFKTLPYCSIIYFFFFILLKVSERIFNKSDLSNYFISKAVKLVWKKYSAKIENGLLDSEKELKNEILSACIRNDSLLNNYSQYCKIP